MLFHVPFEKSVSMGELESGSLNFAPPQVNLEAKFVEISQDDNKALGFDWIIGNFLFNGFETEATTTGWVLSATLGPDGVREWRTHVARLDADGVPHPAPAASSPCGRAGDGAVRECVETP